MGAVGQFKVQLNKTSGEAVNILAKWNSVVSAICSTCGYCLWQRKVSPSSQHKAKSEYFLGSARTRCLCGGLQTRLKGQRQYPLQMAAYRFQR